VRVPHHPLDPNFVRAIRASGHSLVTLAALSGFAANSQLSSVLHGAIPLTPLQIGRLRALAALIHYA
jgi:hypothetical protein